ncbi:hypothetical protein SAMN05444487_10898 [Marininema mesophilum]|uniref:Uncharacterized protein n=1 Tax=Marininema mesophilum TaxID=1048340 RepID=A0A1H2XYQ1_9BACL|nr:hypothetical protein [Marininema mesophilum]SDW97950.1 hypothetical protein SAMN05444487_10898 [Marininema mesophilum]
MSEAIKLIGQIVNLFKEGLTVESIAEILHTSINVVKWALTLAGIL